MAVVIAQIGLVDLIAKACPNLLTDTTTNYAADQSTQQGTEDTACGTSCDTERGSSACAFEGAGNTTGRACNRADGLASPASGVVGMDVR